MPRVSVANLTFVLPACRRRRRRCCFHNDVVAGAPGREIEDLIQGNWNVDHKVDGFNMRTVMMEAAFSGNLAACDALLRRKANPNCREKFGRTALHMAAINFCSDIAKSLLGAKVGTGAVGWGGAGSVGGGD
jgi:hypothetical protein